MALGDYPVKAWFKGDKTHRLRTTGVGYFWSESRERGLPGLSWEFYFFFSVQDPSPWMDAPHIHHGSSFLIRLLGKPKMCLINSMGASLLLLYPFFPSPLLPFLSLPFPAVPFSSLSLPLSHPSFPRLASNPSSSCLYFPSARMTGIRHLV